MKTESHRSHILGLHIAISINRPKDVQGCSVAPEEFSFTAFLALFLFRASPCVLGGGGFLPFPIFPPTGVECHPPASRKQVYTPKL